MHLPSAAQPGVKHHQITGPKPHWVTTIGGDGDIALQQQTGFLFAVGPREGAQLTSQPQMGQPVTPRLCSCAGSGLEVTVMPLAMAA